MIRLSFVVLLLVATVHLPTGHSPLRAISCELQDGNPLAYLLMVCLCGVICIFADRLSKSGHTIRTMLLLLDVVGLFVIACTPPDSRTHESALMLVCVLTPVWFAVMALDYDSRILLILSASCIPLLLLLVFFSIGLAEKGFILYCLISSNVLYYNDLDEENRARRFFPYR